MDNNSQQSKSETGKKEPPQEKTQTEAPRQSSQERIASIITSSLERAKSNGGFLLNSSQKLNAGLYASALQQSPFNKALIAMHSDQNDFKTNLVTFFSEAKKRGESVLSGQKGMPLPWISWTHYEKKEDPNVTISRSDYLAKPKEEQADYKAVRSKEMRIVFNIDQTNMSANNESSYVDALENSGTVQDRPVDANSDKELRVAVNEFIENQKNNLVQIRKDGNGIASYDKASDIVHIPAQNVYQSYPEYVQDVTRQLVSATQHPQRLNRVSSQNYSTLVAEIASATKQLELGLPAKLSNKAMQNVDNMIDMLKNNPNLVDSIEADVNKSMSMIQKANRGEKIEKRPTESDIERWRSQLPKEGTTPDRFDAVLMMRDMEGQWSLLIKPENEKTFAVHPTQADMSMFFNTMRGQTMESTEAFRTEMGQKYYAEVANKPYTAIDIFGENTDKNLKNALEKVLIFKTKDEDSKIMIYPTLTTGDKLKPREINQDQWQLMWLAPDMKDFKKNLAVRIFKDEIAEKMNQSQIQTVEEKQKTEQKESVTLDIPKWSLNYLINGDPEGITDEEKDIVDKFLDENFPDGFIPEELEDTEKEFNISPAFGTRNPNALPDKGESPYQAVDTVAVKFSPAGYFETRNESSEQKAGTNEPPSSPKEPEKYDPKAHEEDKICSKLIDDIAKIDKKCRAETQPNRQRKLYEQKKELEGKLQERIAQLQEQAKNQEQSKEKEQKPKRKELSPLLKQFLDLKAKHPDALLLFRTGDFYETYKEDAEKCSKVLGITLTKSSKVKDDAGKPLAMAGFPYHALDTYLPKLIRAGQRVAICDQIEAPRQTIKRGVNAASHASSSQNNVIDDSTLEQQQNQKTVKEDTQSRGFHR